MDAYVIVAVIGVALLLAELLLPTGGVLAILGILGLVASGALALASGSDSGEYIGGALIALGIVSAVTFYFVTRKVIEAHRDEPVRTGTEELIGSSAEARSAIDPKGQAWAQGTIWSARLAADAPGPVRAGDRVRIEAVDGLTLVVRPESPPTESSNQGAS
jgi:membrane-bound serine protease (ClpP class)